jgi:hypothetical protein
MAEKTLNVPIGTCYNELGNKKFERNGFYENKLMEIINDTKTTIKKILMEPSRPWSLELYKDFINKTTIQMLNQSQTHSILFNNDNNSIITENIGLPRNLNNQRIFNILVYEKSLPYILKYIAFHFYNKNLNNDDVNKKNIFLYCDEDSYAILKKTNEITFQPEIETKKQKLFNQQITIDKFNLSPSEIDLLKSMNIYIVVSSHCLMKGVGGKRAFIQQYNHQLSDNNEDYVCLTIDDNITGLTIQQQGNCTFRKLQQPTFSDECTMLSFVQIYDLLYDKIKTNNNDIVFAGVHKGNGSGDTDKGNNNEDSNSSTIYKLNMSRPSWLINHRYLYNPYFTTFFEDMAFNMELPVTQCMKINVFLRFGHFPSSPKTNCQQKMKRNYLNDQNDNFDIDLSNDKIKNRLEPIYIMYILFVESIYQENPNNITFHYESSPKIYLHFNFFNSGDFSIMGKYICHQLPFFICLLLFFSNKKHHFLNFCQDNKKKYINSTMYDYTIYNILHNIIIENKTKKSETEEITTYNYLYSSETISLLTCFNLQQLFNGNVDYNDLQKATLLRDRFEPFTYSNIDHFHNLNISDQRIRKRDNSFETQTIQKRRKSNSLKNTTRNTTRNTMKNTTRKTTKYKSPISSFNKTNTTIKPKTNKPTKTNKKRTRYY